MTNVPSGDDVELLEETLKFVQKKFDPGKYSGSKDVAALEAFAANLREYWKLHPHESERGRVYASAYFLTDEAQRWWLDIRGPRSLPPDIQTLDQFIEALTAQFAPHASRERATEELRTLKQGKLPVTEYINKFGRLYKKAHRVDYTLLYQWFIAGLAPGERQGVTAWAAAQEMAGNSVELEQMIEFLRIQSKKNATGPTLEGKGLKLREEDEDLEPMDIGAVQVRNRNQGWHKVGDRPSKGQWGQHEGRKETRICYFCGKAGHLVKDCRYLPKMRERADWIEKHQRNQAPNPKKAHQGNKKAPTQEVARWRGQRKSEPQKETHQGSSQQ